MRRPRPRGPGMALVTSKPHGSRRDPAHAVQSLYEFLVSDKRGERALKKAKNWGKKSNFLLVKLRVVFLEMMDNGISAF